MSLADHPYLNPYLGKPAILDSNLVLLRWCVRFDPSLISSFKRISSFSGGDFRLLETTLSFFPILKTTPHVLTEVSNLANSLPSWRKKDWSDHFSREVHLIEEEWVKANTLVHHPAIKLGLTDAALSALAATHVILTVDFPLSGSLKSAGLNVVNFAELRNSLL